MISSLAPAGWGTFPPLQACPHFVTEAMPTISVHGERVSSSSCASARAGRRATFAHAEALLGRHYQLTGRVMHGKSWAAPWATPPPMCTCRTASRRWPGFLWWKWTPPPAALAAWPAWAKPHGRSGDDYKLEVHLFDFAGNLYGQLICVRFLAKLRDEQRFDSLAADGAD